jgi:hypothetical protein
VRGNGNPFARVSRLTASALIVASGTAQPSDEQREAIVAVGEGLHGDETADGKGALRVDDYSTAFVPVRARTGALM